MGEMKKILIIDNKDTASLSYWMLNSMNTYSYKLYSARTGDNGIDAVKKYNPDVVIAELKLSEQEKTGIFRIRGDEIREEIKDGIYVLKKVKEYNQKIPVILMTSNPRDPRIEKAKEEGICYLLIRPFSSQEFQNALRTAFDSSKDLEGNL
jgi:CheY-like chemotaxis protein